MTHSPARFRMMFSALVVIISILSPFARQATAAPDPGLDSTDRALVERSGEIFVGRIDIVTEVLGREKR